jgi:hyaluronan synthase
MASSQGPRSWPARLRVGVEARNVHPALVGGLIGITVLVVASGSVIGVLGLLFLAVKLLVSTRCTGEMTGPLPVDALRVVVLVPMYNEDPEIIRQSVRSLLSQTHMPHRIHIIDDGSRSHDALEAVRQEAADHRTRVRLSRHKFNMGKREAIATAARMERDADIFVTVDSDTVLDPGAIAALLRSFRNPEVRGATALVRVLNRDRNLLTRLIDLRYANAFLLDRGFQSTFGSVLCACGSLAAWRREVLLDNLHDFVGQRFLGQRCTYGDDRRLTNYALTRGRVVLVPDALAYTAAPERLSHYIRQQVRWSRSFIRESLWAVMNLPLRRPAVWLSLAELSAWILLTATLLATVAIAPALGAEVTLTTCVAYLAFTAVMAWVRSVRWFDATTPGESQRERATTFALAPLYAVLHVFVLLPLRFVALATLRTTSWGTRKVVEVRLTPPPQGLSPVTLAASPPVPADRSCRSAA